MAARSPAEISDLFTQYMRDGDLDSALALYDADAVLLNAAGEARKGREAIKEELAPLASVRTEFYFQIKAIVETGDIALTHSIWAMVAPEARAAGYALEVCRRQPDGSWRWLIGDPFTVGRQLAPEEDEYVLEEALP